MTKTSKRCSLTTGAKTPRPPSAMNMLPATVVSMSSTSLTVASVPRATSAWPRHKASGSLLSMPTTSLHHTLFVYTYRHYIRQLATVGDVVYRYRINADSATFSPNLMKRATHHMIVANAIHQMIEQNTDPKAIKTLTFVRNKILSFVQNETKQVLTEKEGVSLQ